jgi:hypothetical protein
MTQHPDETADVSADETRDDQRVETRSELLPEEQAAGSDNPHDQAEAILAESDERTSYPEESREESTQTPDQQNPNEPA